MRLPSLTLALTAFNEEDALPRTLVRCLEFLPTAAEQWELLIIDDGSTDRTREIAQSLADQHDQVRVIAHEENRGMGAAIKTAIGHARQKWFCTIAADGQVDPRDLSVFVSPSLKHDAVFSTYSTREDGWDRKFLTWGFKCLFGTFTGQWKVPTGNYFAKTSLVQSLSLKSNTFFVNFEIYLGLLEQKVFYRWVQIPCTPREHGKSKIRNLRTIFRVALELFRYQLRR